MSIISNIIGGLGNQMFQYAAGFAIAQRLGCPHRLDINSYRHQKIHQGFELHNIFKCSSLIATPSEIHGSTGWGYGLIRNHMQWRWLAQLLTSKNIIHEPYFHYWRNFQDIKDNHYLIGYWQSEKYFSDITTSIKKEFDFRHPLTGKNQEVQELILKNKSVNVHIRRGDYIKNPKANQLHGVCPSLYYQKASEYLAEHFDNLVFFIFSDDTEWARRNLILSGKTVYINHNQHHSSHYDMQLMSHCKHHIIANSTFSWWGGWLSNYPGKIVIAPNKWFIGGNHDTKDLLPDTWIRI